MSDTSQVEHVTSDVEVDSSEVPSPARGTSDASVISETSEVERDDDGPRRPLRFPSPFVFNNREPITLIELRMRRFSGMIRSKPDWWAKINDPQLVAKWRQEMVEQDREAVDRLWGGEERYKHGSGKKKWPRDAITEAQLDYIFDQLKYEASQRDEETGIFASAIPKVYESRSLIPADLKASLLSGVTVLESVPDEEKDWHPDTYQQVLDLVHPSMYCLRIGESLVRSKDESGTEMISVLTEQEYMIQRPDLAREAFMSRYYQWLPTDFEVSNTGGVQALSYINNLHPIRHRALYTTICGILTRFVPLFNKVLSDVLSPEPPLAVKADPYAWYDDIEMPDEEELKKRYGAYESEHERWERWGRWEREERWPVIHDPGPFAPPKDHDRISFELNGRTVQVIVKLANIVLSPENPQYPGGSWHVEGMANERIVATGLYYYSSSNITESRLNFRTVVGEGSDDGRGMPYEQDDHQGYNAVYGFAGGNALNQELGHIIAEEDKCVAFPNIYQHCVDPFELVDRSKPGHRKILCFFLVDPLQRILSTADVPPQQEEWLVDEMLRAPPLRNLPAELFEMVVSYAKEGTITRKIAEEHREKLMEERTFSVMVHNAEVFELKFNMCEH
ncbi:hypothetical protein PYCCODRAFT_1383781 [Trametes coccinea BRFM310]|uniref:Uncharacterized protein n=1 Tax=Trametes coccinea (strain BRFM310) TaxID=1353009 RepID=A0A1Y2J159_TRAC3|nr:hypothetical protein PYCCODRAFT_1383781 [Trametes coccinea BRFM310]